MAETKAPQFSADERAAMKAAAKERKTQQTRADGEKAAADGIAGMPDSDRVMAEKISAVIARVAPNLYRKTYYGMPAWADDDDRVICFFKNASKFKTRYASFEFNDSAHLDGGQMWPISYALLSVGAAEEKQVEQLVKQAIA